MNAVDVLEKIQGYLNEQVKNCNSGREKVSEMTDEERLMYLGKLKALMEFQMLIGDLAIEVYNNLK